MNKPRLLFLSNGHGEDIVGAKIAQELIGMEPSIDVIAMPVVGQGKAYETIGIKTVGPRLIMPSGGLIWRRPLAMLRDLKAGFFNVARDQIRTLKSLSSDIHLVLGVGDKVILFLNDWFIKGPMVFVGLADSKYYAGTRRVYTEPERKIMRKLCKEVFVRDEPTARDLNENGVAARYVGNPMMDTFDITGEDFGMGSKDTVIGILPGSREDAYGNARLILKVAHSLAQRAESIGFLLALAPTLSMDELVGHLVMDGWHCTEVKPRLWSLQLSSTQVIVTADLFGDVLATSHMVIGLTGTANEQAAGLGKPVITFPGMGQQINQRFVMGQKKLLGDAVLVVEGNEDSVTDAVFQLISQPERYNFMAQAGRTRMGGPGGSARIAREIIEILKNP